MRRRGGRLFRRWGVVLCIYSLNVARSRCNPSCNIIWLRLCSSLCFRFQVYRGCRSRPDVRRSIAVRRSCRFICVLNSLKMVLSGNWSSRVKASLYPMWGVASGFVTSLVNVFVVFLITVGNSHISSASLGYKVRSLSGCALFGGLPRALRTGDGCSHLSISSGVPCSSICSA